MTLFRLRQETTMEGVQAPALTLTDHPINDWLEMPGWLRQEFINNQVIPRWADPHWVYDIRQHGHTEVVKPNEWICREGNGYLFKRTNELLAQDYDKADVDTYIPVFLPGGTGQNNHEVGLAMVHQDYTLSIGFNNKLDKDYVFSLLKKREVAIALIPNVPKEN